jgi:hypothetical protein
MLAGLRQVGCVLLSKRVGEGCGIQKHPPNIVFARFCFCLSKAAPGVIYGVVGNNLSLDFMVGGCKISAAYLFFGNRRRNLVRLMGKLRYYTLF